MPLSSRHGTKQEVHLTHDVKKYQYFDVAAKTGLRQS